MSIVPAFLVFLLCLSMHACHARQFRLFNQDSPTTPPRELKENSTPRSISAEGSVKKATDTKQETHSKKMFAEPKGSVTSIRNSGNGIPKSSSLALSIKATDTQGSTRQAPSPVGFGSDVKKATDINKNKLQDVEEVADYNPPHGTPPIHNRKTLTLRQHIL